MTEPRTPHDDGKEQRTPPRDEYDDEFADEDNEERDGLDQGLFQKLLTPFYLFLLLVFLGVASVPFLILYTVFWTIRSASGQ